MHARSLALPAVLAALAAAWALSSSPSATRPSSSTSSPTSRWSSAAPGARIERPAPKLFSTTRGAAAAPSSITCTVRNDAAEARAWSAKSSAEWLSASPSSGELAAGAAATFELSVDPAFAAQSPAGCHIASVELVDAASQSTSSVQCFLAVGEDGWTRFAPSPDTRTVYVSSSTGSDSNDGRSAATAKRTLAAGVGLLRHNHPDWLLLKRGDTWTETFGHWKRSGRSASEPMVISSYGDEGPRPKLLTATASGLLALRAGDSPPSIDYLAIVGLHMKPHEYVGGTDPSAVTWLIRGTGLTIEDCYFEGFEVNIRIAEYDGLKRDFRIRRNILVDAFATRGTVGHGLYLANCDNLLLEENLIDANGYNPDIPEATPSIFRHGVYIQGGAQARSNVVVRGNIVSRSASHGVQIRPGGVVADNLFLRNSIALQLGGGDEPQPGGARAVAVRNVVLEGKDIDESNPRGWALLLENIAGATLQDNVVAHRGGGNFAVPLSLAGDAAGVGVHDVLLEGNVFYDWGGTVHLSGDAARLGPLWFVRNRLGNSLDGGPLLHHRDRATLASVSSSDNRFFSSAAADEWFGAGEARMSLVEWAERVGDTGSKSDDKLAPKSPRTIAAYQASLGETATLEAFLEGARSQSRFDWKPRYTAAAVNAFVRKGFEVR